MSFKLEAAGTCGCDERLYPLLKDNVLVDCYTLPKYAAKAAKDLGALEIDAINFDDVESGTRHALKLKPDGLWCHTFSNM